MAKAHLNLAIGARHRLAILRESARSPRWIRKDMSWRDVRFATFRSHIGLGQGRNADGQPVWYTHSGPAFPREKFADEAEGPRIQHTGWYSDPDCMGTYRGLVVALPHGRFLAGYLVSDNNERVYFPDLFTDEAEAARYADSQAERDAGEEQEYLAEAEEHFA